MALFRKRKSVNLGNVSIGSSDRPTKMSENDESIKRRQDRIDNDTEEKVKKYRAENPEKPASTKKSIESPLKIKRSLDSFDGEYVDLAKRYLKLPNDREPTVVELSKCIIKLFEDNAKLYRELNAIKEKTAGGNKAATKHSWENNNSWN